MSRFAAWGAAAGLLVTAFPFALVALGLASREGSRLNVWQILVAITAPFILLSAGSALVTLALARIAERSATRTSARRTEAPPSRSHTV